MTLLDRPGGRAALFTLLYASEGAPIGFIWWALPTLLRAEGVPVGEITGLTAVLVLPWATKFLWAPLVDVGGQRRRWILGAQLLMGLWLLPLLWLDPVADLGWWRVLLLLHGFCAATQDVAIDALAIATVPPDERGRVNGYMQAGMLAGRSLFGGGLLLAAATLGTRGMIVALIAAIWSTLVLVALVREPAVARARATGREFGAVLRAALGRRTTWLGLAFALTGAAGFEAAGALAGPYLVDRGVAAETIGWFFGVGVVTAMVVGGLAGGRWADRFGAGRVIAAAVLGFSASLFLLAALDRWADPGTGGRLLLLGAMYVGVGVFTASSYALFMNLTDPRLGGTQFSAFMAATNGCESWSAVAGGRLAAGPGYPAAFAALSLVSLAALALVAAISRTGSARADAPKDGPPEPGQGSSTTDGHR